MSSVERLAMKNLVIAHPDDSVLEAVERMSRRRVGAILVVDDDRLVGIFSERDALKRVLAEELDPRTTRVGEVCTRELKVVNRDAPVRECVILVKRHGIRHVPIVDDQGHPVGILSSRDFLSHVINELEELIEKSSTALRREKLTDPYALIGE